MANSTFLGGATRNMVLAGSAVVVVAWIAGEPVGVLVSDTIGGATAWVRGVTVGYDAASCRKDPVGCLNNEASRLEVTKQRIETALRQLRPAANGVREIIRTQGNQVRPRQSVPAGRPPAAASGADPAGTGRVRRRDLPERGGADPAAARALCVAARQHPRSCSQTERFPARISCQWGNARCRVPYPTGKSGADGADGPNVSPMLRKMRTIAPENGQIGPEKKVRRVVLQNDPHLRQNRSG